MSPSSRARGFTLIELLVGLAVAAIAVTTAAMIFAGVSDTLQRLGERSRDQSRRAVAAVWIDQALGSARVAPEDSMAFTGTPDSVEFHTRLWVERGWTEPGRAGLFVADGDLILQYGPGKRVVLLDSLVGAHFAYAARTAGGVEWHTQWSSFTSPPPAIRVTTERAGQGAETVTVYLGRR